MAGMVDEQTLLALRVLRELLEDPDRPDRDERLARFRELRDEIFHRKIARATKADCSPRRPHHERASAE
jgi:hypothetical protein